jgi:tetratricopeptide (TPR) repeat protein
LAFPYSIDEDGAVAFGRSYEKDSKTVIPITHNINRGREKKALRVVGVTYSGREVRGSVSGRGGNILSSNTHEFNLTLRDIKEFRFQTRPYEWVEFKNVSLRPGVKTDVVVERAGRVSDADKRASEDLAADGWRLWRESKLAEAEEAFKRAVDKDPTSANAWNGLGWSQFNQGKALNAKVSFEKCLEIEPKHPAALNGLGWIAKGQDKTGEAIGHWEKAVEAAPTATAALNGLATTYMELKQWEKAAKYYEMWLKVEPNNGDAKAGLEKAKAEKRGIKPNTGTAVQVEVFKAYFPDDAKGGKSLDKLFEIWSERGAISKELPYTDQQTLEIVRKGLQRTKQDKTLVLRLVGNRFIWGKSPQNEDAIDLMYHASYSPDSNIRHYAEYFGLTVIKHKEPKILGRLAQLCMKYKETDIGRIIWGVKVSSQVDDFIALLQPYLNSADSEIKKRAENLVKELKGKPDVQVEVEVVGKVSDADKRASEDLAADGWRLWRQRQLAEAEEKFKEAVNKDSTNDNAYQGLGWAQLNQGKKLNAKDSFEKCIKLNSQNSAALNGLGWIAEGQGKIDEAIGHWEKAVEAAPTATAALSGLGQTYMMLKEYDKAAEYYQMWLNVEPNNAQAKSGLEKAKSQAQLESAKNLSDLGKVLLVYANDHEDRYPAKLEEIQQQPYSPADLKSWALENVEYLGKGKTVADRPNTVIAYDKTLLEKGNGTNVLFNDSHVEFVKPEQLKELGIKPGKNTKIIIRQRRIDAAVYKQLERLVELSELRPEMPFSDALEELKSSVEPPLQIAVLWRDLYDNADIDRTSPIHIDAIPAVRLSTALELILQSVSGEFAELGYVVKGGIIIIATKESLPSVLETNVYDATDVLGQPADYYAYPRTR